MHVLRSAMLPGTLALVLMMSSAGALPKKGDPIPPFVTKDISGREVDLHAELAKSEDDFAILFFFTPEIGEAIAKKLDQLHADVKLKNLLIIAVGMKTDEPELASFAKRLGIQYRVVPDQPGVNAAETFGVTSLPVTLIVTPQKTLLKSIAGAGESEVAILNHVAQTYFMRNQPEKAEQAAEVALKAGESEKAARQLKGFAQMEQGKLDAAAKEFSAIDSKAGQAAVAIKQGQYDEAVRVAEQAPDDGFAKAMKGEALMRAGKLDEAAKALDEAEAKPLEDWQQADAKTAKGRLQQEQGNLDGAVTTYQEALELNPWNVKALSNEAAAYRSKGDLEKAVATLEKAQSLAANDAMVAMVLRQVRQEMENANNTKRRELIQKQIADLQQRAKDLKAAGQGQPVDPWTSRPLVVAFLPTEHSHVFFERAGMDVALQREIEAKVQSEGRMQVVEREVLDTLLQELNIGTSDLANADTQLRLGQVLAAQLLGFADFAQTGPKKTMYLRMVNTETTSIDTQIAQTIDEAADLEKTVDEIVKELSSKVLAQRKLQGLIADAPSDTEILINLGQAHGVKEGMRFAVLQDGKPLESGGRTLTRQTAVATLEVTSVEGDVSVCKVVHKKDGVTLEKDMKVKEAAKA